MYQRTKKTKKRNKAYQKGYRFELRVKKHFEKEGYYVKRSYASKGAEDLIAIKNSGTTYCKNLDTGKYEHITLGSEVLLIQCKNLKVEKPLSKTEQNNIKALAKQTGATPLHAFNRNHKLVIEEIE